MFQFWKAIAYLVGNLGVENLHSFDNLNVRICV